MTREEADNRIIAMWCKVIGLASANADPKKVESAMANARAAEQALARMDIRGKFDD